MDRIGVVWVDYAIYLTSGVVVLSTLALIFVLARRSGTNTLRLVLVGLVVVGVAATLWTRPERFREMGDDMTFAVVDGRLQTEELTIGLCLSIFRRVGPLSFIVGNDLFPGEDWDIGPPDACEASGHIGAISLPDSVRSGSWVLCDYATCQRLLREP